MVRAIFAEHFFPVPSSNHLCPIPKQPVPRHEATNMGETPNFFLFALICFVTTMVFIKKEVMQMGFRNERRRGPMERPLGKSLRIPTLHSFLCFLHHKDVDMKPSRTLRAHPCSQECGEVGIWLTPRSVCLSSICIPQHTLEIPTSNSPMVLVNNANPNFVPDLFNQNL